MPTHVCVHHSWIAWSDAEVAKMAEKAKAAEKAERTAARASPSARMAARAKEARIRVEAKAIRREQKKTHHLKWFTSFLLTDYFSVKLSY